MKRQLKSLVISTISKLPKSDQAATAWLSGAILRGFLDPLVGREYQISRSAKVELVGRIQRINEKIPSATSWISHLVLIQAILNTPEASKGVVVECGSYKGASAASLSLACRLTGRSLLVCDSFEGLPPDDAGAKHRYTHLRTTTEYEEGLFAGSLDEVRGNIEKYGDLSVCKFVQGFFSASLSTLTDPVAFAFFDVDLVSSMRDCIRYIWPLLNKGSKIYTDDSCDMDVVRLWFDTDFWTKELSCEPPGYVGSGCGLPLSGVSSPLGYTVKGDEGSYSFSKFW
jgi:O-methyltransferase